MLKDNQYHLSEPGTNAKCWLKLSCPQDHIAFCLLHTSPIPLAGKLQIEPQCKLPSLWFGSTGHRVLDHGSESQESSLCKHVSATALLACFKWPPTNHVSEGCCRLQEGWICFISSWRRSRGGLEGHRAWFFFQAHMVLSSSLCKTVCILYQYILISKISLPKPVLY